MRRPARATVLQNPTLVGWVLLLCALAGVFISYNASRGLPFVPTYKVSVDVPDAAELTGGTSEVRIGGSRVGLVQEVQAMPGRDGRPAFARLTLALDEDLEPLPADTVVQVRPRSILGAKYLDLTPGGSRQGIPAGGVLALTRAAPAAEFDEAFEVFDRETARGLQGTLTSLGDGLTGRGTVLNDTVGSTRRLMPPLEHVTRTLATPGTELEGFLRGAAAVTGALAGVAPALGSLVDGGATTLTALDAAGDALGLSIAELAPTEVVGTRALERALPVLEDAVAIATDARPGVRLLPAASAGLTRALEEGIPLLRRLNPQVPRAGRLLRALGELADDPATRPSVTELIATVTPLRTTLGTLVPAQTHCNVLGVWARNVGDVLSSGDRAGYWLNTLVVFDLGAGGTGQTLQSGQPDPNLHLNHHPIMDETECEAGNEAFKPGRQIGNVEGRQPNTTEETVPPPGVRDLARRAGLLP